MSYERRDFAKACIAASLISTAGCNSGSSSAPSDDEEDDGTVTRQAATETPTPSLADVTYPDGWSDQGLEDREAAAAGHKSSLSETSFEREQVMDVKHVYDQHAEVSTQVDLQNQLVHVVQKVTDRESEGEPVSTYEYFIDDQYMYRRVSSTETDEKNYSYSRRERTDVYDYHGESLFQTVSLLSYEAEAAVRTGESVAIQFGVTGLSSVGADSRFGKEDSYGGHQSGSLTVTEDGQMSSYDVSLGRKNETDSWLERRVDWSSVGEISVSEPSWVANVESE